MARDKTDRTDKTPPATRGTPDWRDAAAYGDVKRWTLGRWRWAFFRRRDEVRAFFDERAEPQYEGDFAEWQRACARNDLEPAERDFILDHPPRQPHDPRFYARCTPEEQDRFGYMAIYNPRIGEVSNWENVVEQRDSFEWSVSGERGDKVLPSRKLEKHHVVIAFSTARPLAQQLADAASYLKGLQKYRLGHHPQKRRHPTKWLGYLRALDAREADATWQEISALYPQTNQTEQTARDTWEAANALRFNF